jgi:SET domain-containing protein
MRKYFVGDSKINGQGVFAAKDLQKGEIIFILKGKRRHMVEKTKGQVQKNQNMVGIGNNTWIDPRVPASHINHSCRPNVGIRGTLLFVAMRHIRRGEELCFDYSISEEEPRWRLEHPCACQAPKCRRIIRSIQSLSEDVYQSYLPFIPHYFQRVYLKSKTHAL